MPRGSSLAIDGQVRLFFDGIPVDIFLDTTPFHGDIHIHVAEHQLGDRLLPFLGCNDLAVLKTYFNRRKDWADIEEMLRAGRLDLAYVTGVLAQYWAQEMSVLENCTASPRRSPSRAVPSVCRALQRSSRKSGRVL
jgi:hypothetical protein